jgi:DNA polymerase-1
MAETLYLIDAHSLIFQVFHAIPGMSGPKGQPTNAVFGFTGDLLRLRKKDPAYIVCAFDAPGKTFRDAMYAEYKAHRAPMPDDLRQQIPMIHRVLQAMRIPVVEVPGVEADDAIATIATEAEKRRLETLICTGDKDCRQLITEHVKICNIRKEQVMGVEELKADWGIGPGQVVDLLALVGDSVDNVPGLPGVGPKTARKLLQDYGNIENILVNADQLKGRVRENLKSHADQLQKSRELVILKRDVEMKLDWEAWRLQPFDVPALLALFQECGFHRYANEVRRDYKPVIVVRPTGSQQGDLFSGNGQPGETSASDVQTELIDSPAKFEKFLDELEKQPRIAIEAVASEWHPMQADLVGLAMCWQDDRAFYLPLAGLAREEIRERLRPFLKSDQIQKVSHDAKIDLMLLRRAGLPLSGLAGDPMLVSYLLTSGERNHNLEELATRYLGRIPNSVRNLLGAGKDRRRLDQLDASELASAAGEQANAAWRLSRPLDDELSTQEGLRDLYGKLELPLIEVLAAMEYNGVRVDVPLLGRLSEEFGRQLADLETTVHTLAGRPFNIGSPKQLRQVLFDELKLPKQRRTGIIGEASTGQDVLEELAAEGHELPRKVIEHRQLAKLKGTYIDALPGLVNPLTGRVHASFNQASTATGRLSSSDPNLQNIPIRTDQGRQIRQAFIAGEPGWLLLTADYSQIELRFLAHYSKDTELQRAFQEDRDIHAYVAAQIYGVPEEQVDRHQRRNAKMVNFGVIYGLSAFGLAQRLGISKEEAGEFIDAYFRRYPGIGEFQARVLEECRTKGYVTTILGRRRFIEGIRSKSSYKQRNQAEREALNAVLQGSAADLIKQAMLNIHRRLRKEELSARMLLQIHDELVFEVPESELERTAGLVAEEMTSAVELSVPLKVDVAAGKNWLDVETVEVRGAVSV